VAAHCGAADAASGKMRLYGRVTALDGSVQLTASALLEEGDPAATGRRVADLLAGLGASRLLAQ
jgi:hypothetical protein